MSLRSSVHRVRGRVSAFAMGKVEEVPRSHRGKVGQSEFVLREHEGLTAFAKKEIKAWAKCF